MTNKADYPESEEDWQEVQSPQRHIEGNHKRDKIIPDGSHPADTLKSDEEILKELKKYEPFKDDRDQLLKAIALTREACEKNKVKKIFSIDAYDEGFEEGQKAEQERILEIIDKNDWLVKPLKNELKKEVLKHDRT